MGGPPEVIADDVGSFSSFGGRWREAEQFPEQKSGGWNRSKRVNAIAIIIPLFRSFYPPSCDTVTPYRNICIKEEISLTFLSLEPSTITFTTFLRSGAG